MMSNSLDKVWSDELERATETLAASMKEAQKTNTSMLMAELPKMLPTPKQVALIYDERMLLHIPSDERDEVPDRLSSIMAKLKSEKLIDRCDHFTCQEAVESDLLLVHNPTHIEALHSILTKSQEERDIMASDHSIDGDLYYSKYSGKAALLAAGGAVKACSLIAEGSYRYSFAIVRPPGHHAGKNGPAGFCLLNNVAIGVSHLLQNYQMRKVLVIDWDIHHGNGTQEVFYDDKRVLFFSVHRHDESFYPNNAPRTAKNFGEGDGLGYNINVCWENANVRNADYVAVWDYVLIPLIQEFAPEVIVISAGFDAGKDDPLGGCCVTPNGFATLLHMLMRFAPIVMVLEGGYHPVSLSKCASACVKVLLGDKCVHDRKGLPYDKTWTTIIKTRTILRQFWKAFEDEIPEKISSRCKPFN